MPNYQFVINSSFKPFSMQEMLVPFTMYKEAYDKAEQEYIDRQDKIDKYSFLNNYDDSSTAKQLYQGYVNEYNKSFDDFSKNGLSQGNRRSWLNVRRRYQKNIGRLEDADKAMQEELTRRQTLDANDPTRIYAKDTVNLSIDDYLDRKKPNDYSVSGQKLYERGVQIGASDSSRIWSSPKVQQVNDYYQSLYQTSGRDPRVLAEWRANLTSIPELSDSLNATLKEFGVTDNLTGNSFERARESVINGIINGATYKRADNFQRDLSRMSAAEQSEASYRQGQLAVAQGELELKQNAAKQDEWMYNHNLDGTRSGLSDEGQAYLSIMHPKSSNGTNRNSQKTGKHTLRSGDYIEGGKVKRTTTGQQAGEEISYNEAVEADPSIAQYDPGYESHYRYYKNGNRITPIRKYTSVDENGQGNNEGGGTPDDNQI